MTEALAEKNCVLCRDVRFGSLADIRTAQGHVRFAPNSDRESGHFPQLVMTKNQSEVFKNHFVVQPQYRSETPARGPLVSHRERWRERRHNQPGHK